MSCYRAYKNAGADYLGTRMALRIFTKIESEEDKVLHNDMVKDVLEIIEGGEVPFFKTLAEDMLFSAGTVMLWTRCRGPNNDLQQHRRRPRHRGQGYCQNSAVNREIPGPAETQKDETKTTRNININ